MSYFVYILKSVSTGRYYTGQTDNVVRRLERHNNDLVTSTRGKGPWILELEIEQPTRGQAVILERKIKKRGAKRFLDSFGV